MTKRSGVPAMSSFVKIKLRFDNNRLNWTRALVFVFSWVVVIAYNIYITIKFVISDTSGVSSISHGLATHKSEQILFAVFVVVFSMSDLHLVASVIRQRSYLFVKLNTIYNTIVFRAWLVLIFLRTVLFMLILVVDTVSMPVPHIAIALLLFLVIWLCAVFAFLNRVRHVNTIKKFCEDKIQEGWEEGFCKIMDYPFVFWNPFIMTLNLVFLCLMALVGISYCVSLATISSNKEDNSNITLLEIIYIGFIGLMQPFCVYELHNDIE